MQVAEHAYPLLQRRILANPMREHRNNRAHEEVFVVGGAAPHGCPQVTQEGHIGRGKERGKMWAGREEEIMDRLHGRGSSAIWHHRELEHCRT